MGQGPLTDAVLGQLMLAFEGTELPAAMASRFRERPAAGVTLFRHDNVDTPAQLRALTDAIQASAPSDEPYLVAVDQEGGQLVGLGAAATPFAGAMALAAVRDADLARRVAEATGRELRAVGVNVNYAPVCDLATNPGNPGLGVRAFGDDPDLAAELVAATVQGLASAGVAATLKHFPGIGEVQADTHHGATSVEVDGATLRGRELAPFRSGVAAGAALVMTAHAAVPAVSGGDAPSTVSRGVVSTLLREEVGFEGVAISDALNMRALAQDEAGRAIEAIAALKAGQDLLLLTAGDAERTSLEQALLLAVRRGLVDPGRTAASLERVARLRRRLAAPPADGEPGLDVVGCAAHRAIADELAQRALTLVRDDAGLLPLRLDPGDELLAVMPRPVDLTPADTSSFVPAGLAAALGRHHPRVREVLVSQEPTAAEVAGAVAAAQTAATVVVGTISASLQPGQASLVEAILDAGTPTVTVALRTPWDGEAYPRARTHLCTYSVLEPSLIALADGLFGAAPFQGRMPVRAVAAWA